MSADITLVEVGPRDGLQNEPRPVDIETRVELIRRLAAAGLNDIEAGAFVAPGKVPQMAASAEVLPRVIDDQRRYWVLVPNRRGFNDALAAGARHIAVFTAASETFSRENTGATIAQSLERIREVTTAAKTAGVLVRGYVSCALGCPYEGEVDPRRVLAVTGTLFEAGCGQVSVGDTIGTGTLTTTRALFRQLTGAFPAARLAAHFHDTYGQALANLTAVLDCGVRTIDSSIAGLGGCPYAPGATGNVATEDVVRFCEGLGLKTGINPVELAQTGEWISSLLGRPNASRAGRACLARRTPNS